MGLHGHTRVAKRASRSPPIQEYAAPALPSEQDTAEVQLLLYRWVQAVQNGDGHQLASLYSQEGTLQYSSEEAGQGPHSSCPTQGLHALASLGAIPTILSSSIQFLSPTVAICTGTYSLQLPPEPTPSPPLYPQPMDTASPTPSLPWLNPHPSSSFGSAMVPPSAPRAVPSPSPRPSLHGRSSSMSGSSSSSSGMRSSSGSISSGMSSGGSSMSSSSGGRPGLWGLEQMGSWEAEAALPQPPSGDAAWLTALPPAAAGWEQQPEGEVVLAGFLFVYCQVNGRWLIAEHHSRELDGAEEQQAGRTAVQGSTAGAGERLVPWTLPAGNATSALLQ